MELCGITFVDLMLFTGRGFKIKSLRSCSYHIISLKIALVIVVISILINYLLTDARTDRHGVYGEITLNRSCNAFKFNPSKKYHAVPNPCKKDGQIKLKHLLQLPAQPSPFLDSTENTPFIYLPKKSKYLKADFW